MTRTRPGGTPQRSTSARRPHSLWQITRANERAVAATDRRRARPPTLGSGSWAVNTTGVPAAASRP